MELLVRFFKNVVRTVMGFQSWAHAILLFSLYHMCRARFPSRSLEWNAFPSLLVSRLKQLDND
jgi:hypothetical protein